MFASAIKIIRDNVGFTLSHAVTVGCVVAMGTAATLIAGTVLWSSQSRKITTDLRDRILKREHARKQQHDALRADIDFDALLWPEYDAMLLSAPAPAPAPAFGCATKKTIEPNQMRINVKGGATVGGKERGEVRARERIR